MVSRATDAGQGENQKFVNLHQLHKTIRQTDRQKDRQANSQSDRKTDRQTERHFLNAVIGPIYKINLHASTSGSEGTLQSIF